MGSLSQVSPASHSESHVLLKEEGAGEKKRARAPLLRGTYTCVCVCTCVTVCEHSAGEGTHVHLSVRWALSPGEGWGPGSRQPGW